jgi:ribonucleotide reductase alpha subunit
MNLKVKDNNETLQDFSKEKITIHLFELMCYIGEPNLKLAEKISSTIEDIIIQKNISKINKEDLELIIKEVLKENYSELLQAFILRKQDSTNKLNIDLDLKYKLLQNIFNLDSKEKVDNYLYNLRNYLIEKDSTNKESYNIIFKYISEGIFYPSTNILLNLNSNLNSKYSNLFSSYSLKIEDNLESIFSKLSLSSVMQKKNSNTAINLSYIRSKNEIVNSINKKACGPSKIIDLYISAHNLINYNSTINSNNLFYINIEHPDIFDFIKKSEEYKNTNFCLLIPNRFMENLLLNSTYIINKDNCNNNDNNNNNSNNNNNNNNNVNSNDENTSQKTINNDYIKENNSISNNYTIDPVSIMDFLVTNIYNGNLIDLIFIDKLEEKNKFLNYKNTELSAVGNQPIFENEGFVSGVIDISKFVNKVGSIRLFDWNKFKQVIMESIKFLDNIIDISSNINEKFENNIKNTRRIYLSLTGFATLLSKLHIPYNSYDALLFGEKISEFTSYYSKYKSMLLSKTKGPFLKYIKSKYDSINFNFNTHLIQKTLFNDQKLAKKLLANKPVVDWDELKNNIKKYGIRNSTTYSVIFSDIFSTINNITNSINPIEKLKYNFNINGIEFTKINSELLLNVPNINTENTEEEIEEKLDINTKNRFITSKNINSDFYLKLQNSFEKYCDGVCNINIYITKEKTISDIKDLILKSYKYNNTSFFPKIKVSENQFSINSKECRKSL